MNRSPSLKPHLGPGGGGSFPQCGTCRLCIRLCFGIYCLWGGWSLHRVLYRPTEGIGDDPKQAIHPDKVRKLISACREVWKNRYLP